jgi:hypothetical protein
MAKAHRQGELKIEINLTNSVDHENEVKVR